MPLFSMTGFARTSFEAEGDKFTWELKSVNARGLEIRFRLPPGMDPLEPDIRSLAREHIGRGSCFFALQMDRDPAVARLSLNEESLALVVAAARRLATVEGIAMPSADGILAIPGVLQNSGRTADGEAAERRTAVLLKSFMTALELLRAARADEGARLHDVVADQLATVERLVGQAAELAATAPAILRARIQEQVSLLAENSSLDPDRLHQEAVLAAARADVREELDRLRSHLAAARKLLQSGTAVGRRLDFLTQEFNREANTLCSKAFDRDLTAVGLELKAVIDQMREQIQNIE